MLPTNNSYSSTSNPHAPSEPSPSTDTGRSASSGRRDPPLRNATGGHPPRSRPVPGHRHHPSLLSSSPALGTPSWAQTPPLPPSSPPARAEPRPTRLVPSGLDTRPPHLSWKCRRHVATCRRRHNVSLQLWPDGSVKWYSTLVLTTWFVSACEYAGNGSRYEA